VGGFVVGMVGLGVGACVGGVVGGDKL